MRFLALALLPFAALLPGCTQMDPGDGDGFEASCPAWTKGLGTQVISGTLLYDRNSTSPDLDRWDFREATDQPGTGLGDGYLSFREHPLDQIVLDFHYQAKNGNMSQGLYVQDAELRLSLFHNEGGQPGAPAQAWDESRGRASAQHEWVFRSDPAKKYSFHNVTLRIDLAEPDAEPDPHGVFAHWEMVPDLDGDRQQQTGSLAVMRYSPQLWYRTCSEDGTKV